MLNVSLFSARSDWGHFNRCKEVLVWLLRQHWCPDECTWLQWKVNAMYSMNYLLSKAVQRASRKYLRLDISVHTELCRDIRILNYCLYLAKRESEPCVQTVWCLFWQEYETTVHSMLIKMAQDQVILQDGSVTSRRFIFNCWISVSFLPVPLWPLPTVSVFVFKVFKVQH